MLSEAEVGRSVALEPVGPSEPVESLLGLLLVPFAIVYGILFGLWRLVRFKKVLVSPAMRFARDRSPMTDVASFAAEAEVATVPVRRGFGALDFELSYARDFLPSSLDAYPKLANRYFSCEPPFRRVTFGSFDGTPLAAEIAEHEDGDRPGLVVVHGTFGSSGQEIYSAPAMRAFAEWGFNVAVVDLRGWGRSSALSKAPMSGGWREAEDVLAAAKHLLDTTRTFAVGAMGYSLGGAAVLLASAHERAPELLASGVFSESGFVDAREVVTIVDGHPSPLARKFIPHWIFRLGLGRKFAVQGYRRTGIVEYFERVTAPFYDVSEDELYRRDSVVTMVERIGVPAFHLHAVDDWIVPVEHAARLREAALRAGNRLVGVCIRTRGGHCAFRRVFGDWRSDLAREFFLAASGTSRGVLTAE